MSRGPDPRKFITITVNQVYKIERVLLCRTYKIYRRAPYRMLLCLARGLCRGCAQSAAGTFRLPHRAPDKGVTRLLVGNNQAWKQGNTKLDMQCLRIWDIYPGSEFFPSRILTKEFQYFNPKEWFLSSRKYDSGWRSRIRILTFYPSRISDPGSRGQTPDPGSGTLPICLMNDAFVELFPTIFWIFKYFVQHSYICRPSDFTVSNTGLLRLWHGQSRLSVHSARSHNQS